MATNPPAPSERSGRLLAPDFARGSMLLLIVLSNTTFFLYAGDYTRSDEYPDPTGPADTIVQFLMAALLDVRVYPLFAFLVGYGLVQVFTRRRETGMSEPEAAAQLRRRNLWLVVLGFVHALLLLATEVLAAYGLVGLVLCALFLRAGERRMRGWAIAGGCVLALATVAAAAAIVASYAIDPTGATNDPAAVAEANSYVVREPGQESYGYATSLRLYGWGILLAINAFGVVLPLAMLLGMWAAHRRVIEEAGQNLHLLRRVAVGGLALGLAGALPKALAVVGVWDPPLQDVSMPATTVLAWATGLAGGLGYAAIFVLLAERLTRAGRVPTVVGAVSALGKRSLSGYLVHSIVLAPVLAAWGLGLGAHLTSATMALFATLLWLATVVIAAAMERRGTRGPFEVLLRRLVHGRTTRSSPVP